MNLVGKTISGRYRVEAFIAAGGMGSVFKALDLKRNIYLAMKVLHGDLAEDPVMFRRFKREARALQKLTHPNIVPFYGLGETRDFVFMLQQFINGPTLKEIIKRKNRQPLTERETLIFLKSICSALGYAHSAGVVHCDLKPANILIDQGGQIYLGDFGIARHIDSTVTTMADAGTPAYMAPEQILGKSVSSATDVYALGVLLYEMLSGRRPFLGTEKGAEGTGRTNRERIRYAHLNLQPINPRVRNPKINEQLASAILQALEKDPGKRFQSCHALMNAVCQALGIQSGQIQDQLPSPRLQPRKPTPPVVSPPVNSPLVSPPVRPAVVPRPRNSKTPFIIGGIVIGIACILIIGVAALAAINPPTRPASIPRDSNQGDQVINEPISDPPNQINPTKTLIRNTATQRSQSKTSTPDDSCPGAPPQRMVVGKKGYVCNATNNDFLNLRAGPSVSEMKLRQYGDGRTFSVLGGPVCANNYTWWYIQVSGDPKGWVAEGSRNPTDYFICPGK
ncbi:protein kinase [Chloroflexota bacterium]